MSVSPQNASSASVMGDARPGSPEDVGARLALAVGRLNRRLQPFRPELSHGLLMALSSIVRKGPLRPGELAKLEAVAPPTATRIVVELEKRGLVERSDDPDDGRSFFVGATEEGTAAILAARHERAVHAAELLSALTSDEFEAISGALEALEKASLAECD
ncbi:MarR family winged helix-turn-helix transcriptional regulator [Frondihabitans cladoniiphilus]|uniref:MarR family transcriptional regulator n=1 Tax=Frondihabitans cladoniiphilus TaxID=715785 RepID=A0ABP8VMG2_9MICO